jgi:hypothetical protein
MTDGFLLGRVLLRFHHDVDRVLNDLSAVTTTPSGHLWVGTDEGLTIERLSTVSTHEYGQHQSFAIGDFIEVFDHKEEADIEGLDYAAPYLWFTGSHSLKRKKPKKRHSDEEAIEQLEAIKPEPNRYLLGRIPVVHGDLVAACDSDREGSEPVRAGCLKKTAGANVLIDVLEQDEHLKPFMALPSKDNGLDIEGLAVRDNRIFLGLRGPVLRGWAVILELAVFEQAPGVLALQDLDGTGRLLKKHFVDLDGLGIRDLCWLEDDLLVLAGPTMVLDGATRVYRFCDAFHHPADSLSRQDHGEIQRVCNLPVTPGFDRAEGLLHMTLHDQPALLVLYDAPHESRIQDNHAIFADVFRLPSGR